MSRIGDAEASLPPSYWIQSPVFQDLECSGTASALAWPSADIRSAQLNGRRPMPTIERVRASHEQPHTAMRGRQGGSGGKAEARHGRIIARHSATSEAPVRTPPIGGALP